MPFLACMPCTVPGGSSFASAAVSYPNEPWRDYGNATARSVRRRAADGTQHDQETKAEPAAASCQR